MVIPVIRELKRNSPHFKLPSPKYYWSCWGLKWQSRNQIKVFSSSHEKQTESFNISWWRLTTWNFLFDKIPDEQKLKMSESSRPETELLTLSLTGKWTVSSILM